MTLGISNAHAEEISSAMAMCLSTFNMPKPCECVEEKVKNKVSEEVFNVKLADDAKVANDSKIMLNLLKLRAAVFEAANECGIGR